MELSNNSSPGHQLRHGTVCSGYCNFMATKFDSVPSSFSDDLLFSVLFFLTILNNYSSPALLWGKTKQVLQRLVNI